MSLGLEVEDRNAFLRSANRYVINTETLPQIREDWTLELNHTFGEVEWKPEIMQLIPVAGILNTLAILEDPKLLYEKIRIHKVANLAIENYINFNKGFFEEKRRVPQEWYKQNVLFLGTIASKVVGGKRKFYSSGLTRQVELSDMEALREARVLVYPDWYEFVYIPLKEKEDVAA